jgi:hypothetical protein
VPCHSLPAATHRTRYFCPSRRTRLVTARLPAVRGEVHCRNH